MAYTEVSAFGDLESPDLYYDYYPTEYQGRRGTMVPFSLRLLAAQIPARYQRPDESQRKLCRLLYTVRKIIRQLQQFVPYNWSAEERQEAARLWAEREARVVQALIHCALVNKVCVLFANCCCRFIVNCLFFAAGLSQRCAIITQEIGTRRGPFSVATSCLPLVARSHLPTTGRCAESTAIVQPCG